LPTTVNAVSPNAAARSTNSPRAPLPSLSAMLWVILFLGLSFTSARVVIVSGDSDPSLHRRLGEWMIQHRAIVGEDNLLHTYHGSASTMEWLSEVIMAALGNWLGWNGVVLLAAALIATCFWLLHRQLLGEGSDPVTATILVLVAMLTCSMHWLARPLLFTHLMTVVFAWQLRWFQRGRVTSRRLFTLLPPLMALWVNLHGGFLMGLILIAMYAVGEVVDSWSHRSSVERFKPLAALFVICCAATLVNPVGWRLPWEIMSFLRTPELSTLTTEFLSPNFHTVGMHGFLLLLLLLAVGLIVIRPKATATDVVLIGGWGYLALLSARNVPIFALVVTPILGQWFAEFTRDGQDRLWVRRYREWTERMPVASRRIDVAIMLATIIAALAVMAKPALAGGAPLIATDYPSTRYPMAVVDYLRAHPDAVHGEMFNYFLWGGYIEFALPSRKPFIDSRQNCYGIDVFHEFRTADQPKPGWEAVFAKYHVGWTILPVQHPLNRILELSPGWTRVYSDRLTLVFSRVS